MTKQETVEQLEAEHRELEEVISSLSTEQITKEHIFDDWTMKDVVAHISAWNWEVVKGIDEGLQGQKPWYVQADEDEFNAQTIKKRKNWSWEDVLQEWKDSWGALLKRVERLSDDEWRYQIPHTWPDGTPLTIGSLFDYEYEGANHEGGHAKQIREHFRL